MQKIATILNEKLMVRQKEKLFIWGKPHVKKNNRMTLNKGRMLKSIYNLQNLDTILQYIS